MTRFAAATHPARTGKTRDGAGRYLLHWGIALQLDHAESEPRTLVGSPAFMAPEMVRADPRHMDARTDVYQLGANLFRLLAGRAPHESKSTLAALAHALLCEVPALPAGSPLGPAVYWSC